MEDMNFDTRVGQDGAELGIRHYQPREPQPVLADRVEQRAIDVDAAGQRPRVHLEAVRVLADVAAEPVQLLGQRSQPVGLLEPDVRHAPEPAGGVGQRRERRQDQGQLRRVAQVRVDPVQPVAAVDGDAVVGALDPRAAGGPAVRRRRQLRG